MQSSLRVASKVSAVLMLGLGGRQGGQTMPRVQLPAVTPRRKAWNKGRIVGQKRPLLPKQVWAIRARLELANSGPTRCKHQVWRKMTSATQIYLTFGRFDHSGPDQVGANWLPTPSGQSLRRLTVLAHVAIRMAAESSGCRVQFPDLPSCPESLQEPISAIPSKLFEGTLELVSEDRYPAIIRPALASAFWAEAVDL